MADSDNHVLKENLEGATGVAVIGGVGYLRVQRALKKDAKRRSKSAARQAKKSSIDNARKATELAKKQAELRDAQIKETAAQTKLAEERAAQAHAEAERMQKGAPASAPKQPAPVEAEIIPPVRETPVPPVQRPSPVIDLEAGPAPKPVAESAPASARPNLNSAEPPLSGSPKPAPGAAGLAGEASGNIAMARAAGKAEVAGASTLKTLGIAGKAAAFGVVAYTGIHAINSGANAKDLVGMAADIAIPDISTGFQGITNSKLGWVERSLNAADTATGTVAVGATVVAGGAAVTGVGAPVAAVSGVVAVGAGIANGFVQVGKDMAYATGYSTTGGPVTAAYHYFSPAKAEAATAPTNGSVPGKEGQSPYGGISPLLGRNNNGPGTPQSGTRNGVFPFSLRQEAALRRASDTAMSLASTSASVSPLSVTSPSPGIAALVADRSNDPGTVADIVPAGDKPDLASPSLPATTSRTSVAEFSVLDATGDAHNPAIATTEPPAVPTPAGPAPVVVAAPAAAVARPPANKAGTVSQPIRAPETRIALRQPAHHNANKPAIHTAGTSVGKSGLKAAGVPQDLHHPKHSGATTVQRSGHASPHGDNHASKIARTGTGHAGRHLHHGQMRTAEIPTPPPRPFDLGHEAVTPSSTQKQNLSKTTQAPVHKNVSATAKNNDATLRIHPVMNC